ncbi:hypothetical protein OGAPHI_006721 [Ogataea philodendri]|uniref:2-dehydropantoate 2-reductase n=1 Tax=Ogataea philodendri TaxID=1378263 RepID=A0A9P8NXM2_9ASCO|nr:uncharacterized protein OGAPHI_006721 [Ogataea philodendri]KAH3661314.1 hypothetical protein OGAPHI_006721 [Ogataea philodendri]
MTTKPKVLLVGMGGVGTIVAYGIQYTGKADVTAVVRSDYDTLTTQGFDLESVDYGNVKGFRPTNVYKSVDDAVSKHGPFDYVVFSMKNTPDIQPIEPLIEKCYHEGIGIVLMQNGYGIHKSVLKKFPTAYVISGVSMISSTLYGRVIKHVGQDAVKVGVCDNGKLDYAKQEQKCKDFIDLYSNDKNDIVYDEDVNYSRWRKLVYNATVNSTAALTNVDIGRLELFGGIDSIVRPAMKEILAIAKSDGVDLPESIIDFMIRSDDGEWYPPSMLIDIRKGNYTEYQVIVGNALDVAKQNNVPAPTLTVLYNLLHVIQWRTMEAKGRFVLPEKRPLPEDNFHIEFK